MKTIYELQRGNTRGIQYRRQLKMEKKIHNVCFWLKVDFVEILVLNPPEIPLLILIFQIPKLIRQSKGDEL
jgi:hypothetical protein